MYQKVDRPTPIPLIQQPATASRPRASRPCRVRVPCLAMPCHATGSEGQVEAGSCVPRSALQHLVGHSPRRQPNTIPHLAKQAPAPPNPILPYLHLQPLPLRMAASATGVLLHSRTELSPLKRRLPSQKVQPGRRVCRARSPDRRHRLAQMEAVSKPYRDHRDAA